MVTVFVCPILLRVYMVTVVMTNFTLTLSFTAHLWHKEGNGFKVDKTQF